MQNSCKSLDGIRNKLQQYCHAYGSISLNSFWVFYGQFSPIFDIILFYVYFRKSKIESVNSTKENKCSPITDEAIDKRKDIVETGMKNSCTVKPNVTTLHDKRIPFACIVTQLMSQNSHQSSPQRYILAICLNYFISIV